MWWRGVADLETPVAAFLKLAHGRPNSFLLESIEGGAARGRYSIIGMDPDLIWRCRDGRAELNRNARSAPHAFVPEDRPALESLRALIAETRLDVPNILPPMSGGLVGYLGYDMVRLMERLPAQNPEELGVPDALLIRPTLFAIFDNVNDELTLVAPVYPHRGTPAATAWAAAEARLTEAQAALDRPLPHPAPPVALPEQPPPESNLSEPEFLAARQTRQGVHRRRRRVPDRAQPALLHPVRPAALRAVSRAATDQPGAIPVLPRFRWLRGRWLQPGDPGPATRRHRDAAPPGRDSPARHDA